MSTRPSQKRLMVATDLSPHADFAVRRALQLAAAHEAEVDLVHIIEQGLPLGAQKELMATSEKSVQGIPTVRDALRARADTVLVGVD